MGINPIRRDPVHPVTGSDKSPRASQRSTTAAKVGQIVRFPSVTKQQEGLRGRQVTPLSLATEFMRNIQKNWNQLPPQELAEQLIELEGRVAHLEGTSPAVDKIKRQVEHLLFQFVFPVVLELHASPSDPSMPFSFAKEVAGIAKRVLQSHSLQDFQHLNFMQQQEVMRILAAGRGG